MIEHDFYSCRSAGLVGADGLDQGGPGGLEAGVEVAVVADLFGGHPLDAFGLPGRRRGHLDRGQAAASGLDADGEGAVGPAAAVRAGRLELGGDGPGGDVDSADLLAGLAHGGVPRCLADVDRAAEGRPGTARGDLAGAMAEQDPGAGVRGYRPGQDSGGATRAPVAADMAVPEPFVRRAMLTHGCSPLPGPAGSPRPARRRRPSTDGA